MDCAECQNKSQSAAAASFPPTVLGRSESCDALLPSPGVKDGGMTSANQLPDSCYVNVGENTDDWRTPQDNWSGRSSLPFLVSYYNSL